MTNASLKRKFLETLSGLSESKDCSPNMALIIQIANVKLDEGYSITEVIPYIRYLVLRLSTKQSFSDDERTFMHQLDSWSPPSRGSGFSSPYPGNIAK